MEDTEYTTEDKEVVIETHFFTTMRYKCAADNGFSGNIAMLCHAVEYSDKVLDEDIKMLARSLLPSVIKHKVITHSKEDIQKALDEMKSKAAAAEAVEAVSGTP